jgi:hypothetical protein
MQQLQRCTCRKGMQHTRPQIRYPVGPSSGLQGMAVADRPRRRSQRGIRRCLRWWIRRGTRTRGHTHPYRLAPFHHARYRTFQWGTGPAHIPTQGDTV